MKKTIYLSTLIAELYERGSETWFRIKPIPGTQINFIFDHPISHIRELADQDSQLVLKAGALSVKMSFQAYIAGLSKVRIIPYLFGILPFGLYPCEISRRDRDFLFDTFAKSETS